MTVQVLALIGLVLAVGLYALLVRRRAAGRLDALILSRAVAESNEIALSRIHNAPRDRAAALEAIDDRGDVPIAEERRSGTDRRAGRSRWGRGRRSGGDRRRGHRH